MAGTPDRASGSCHLLYRGLMSAGPPGRARHRSGFLPLLYPYSLLPFCLMSVAREFETSVRTSQRDLDVLLMAGLPYSRKNEALHAGTRIGL